VERSKRVSPLSRVSSCDEDMIDMDERERWFSGRGGRAPSAVGRPLVAISGDDELGDTKLRLGGKDAKESVLCT